MEGNKDNSNTKQNNELYWSTQCSVVISYGLDTGSDVNINMILGATFCSEEIETARDVPCET